MIREMTPRSAEKAAGRLFTLTLAALLALGLSAGQAAAHDLCVPSDPALFCEELVSNQGRVKAESGRFILGTAPFRFVGTNAYYMHDATSYEAPGGRHRAAEMMHLANDLGFTVVRMWGFMNADGAGNNNGTLDQRLLQPQPGVYIESEFAHLDYVLAQANAHNVRVIFTLGNNWKEYGGVDQLLKWCAPGQARKAFFTSLPCKDLYKGYIRHVLNRPNTINGRVYKDDPTIFAWELMNEPRCPNCDPEKDGATLHAWMTDMAKFIKTPVLNGGLGATQMVATGEEGFDCTWKSTWIALGYQDRANIRLHPWMYDGSQGLCYGKNTRIPEVDFGSFHIWPEAWRFKDGAQSEKLWIRDHILIAKAGRQTPGDESAWNGAWESWGDTLDKPAVLGEFGSSRSDRAAQFEGWLNAVATEETFQPYPGKQGDGALVWQIMCPLCKNHATRLEVIFPPVSNESATVCKHANVAKAVYETEVFGKPQPVLCSSNYNYAPPEPRR